MHKSVRHSLTSAETRVDTLLRLVSFQLGLAVHIVK